MIRVFFPIGFVSPELLISSRVINPLSDGFRIGFCLYFTLNSKPLNAVTWKSDIFILEDDFVYFLPIAV